jgi:hypothetical protein
MVPSQECESCWLSSCLLMPLDAAARPQMLHTKSTICRLYVRHLPCLTARQEGRRPPNGSRYLGVPYWRCPRKRLQVVCASGTLRSTRLGRSNPGARPVHARSNAARRPALHRLCTGFGPALPRMTLGSAPPRVSGVQTQASELCRGAGRRSSARSALMKNRVCREAGQPRVRSF